MVGVPDHVGGSGRVAEELRRAAAEGDLDSVVRLLGLGAAVDGLDDVSIAFCHSGCHYAGDSRPSVRFAASGTPPKGGKMSTGRANAAILNCRWCSPDIKMSLGTCLHKGGEDVYGVRRF